MTIVDGMTPDAPSPGRFTLSPADELRAAIKTGTVQSVYPNFAEIVRGSDFRHWLAKQSKTVNFLVDGSDDPADAIVALDAFIMSEQRVKREG